MKATHKTLAQFLAEIGFSEQQLKQLTGILITRLRAIYRHGKFTEEEFMSLVKAMTVRPAVSLAYASQVGNFNQSGTGNEQFVVINNIVNIVMQRMGITPGAARPRALPTEHKLVISVQQRVSHQLPASQAVPIGSSAPTGCIY